MKRPNPRGGFTLIELLLSVAICMVLLGGLYFAVDIQVKTTRTGREVVDEAMLARAVLELIARDVESTITLNHPFKFRKGNATFASNSSSDDTSSQSDSSSGSDSSGSAGTSSSDSSGSSSDSSQETAGSSVYLPPGVVGFPDALNLYSRKAPVVTDSKNSIGAPGGQGDLRRVCYYMARVGTPEEALVRYEVSQPLSQEGLNIGLMPQDDTAPVVAEEIRAVRFQYHSGPGGSWTDQWDSRSMDYDDLTPIGPPRAVRVEVDIEMAPRPGQEPVTKTYSRVVVIPVGNVPSIQTRVEGGS